MRKNLLSLLSQSRVAALCFGLMMLCSCATENSARPQLPADASINPSAGRMCGNDGVDHLFIKLHLENETDLIFAVDTGSPFTVLDKSLQSKLGKPIGTRRLNYSSFQDVTANEYNSPKLYIGNTPLRLGKFVVTDRIERIMPGRPVAGVLGMDCLRHYCIQLDFASQTIRFPEPDGFQVMTFGKPFPLVHIGSNLSTSMEVNGKNTWFLVDTGWIIDGALKPEFLGDAMKVQKLAKVMQVQTSAGAREQWSCFPAFVLGGETYTNILMQQSSGKVMGNILGLRFLARNLVTLDFPNRTMYLKQTSVGPLIDKKRQPHTAP